MQRHHMRALISFSAAVAVSATSLTIEHSVGQAATGQVRTLTGKTISFANHVAHVYGLTVSGTTYMPIWYVMQALSNAGFTNTWDGSTWNFTTPSGTTTDLSQIQVGSGNASLVLDGTVIHKVVSISYKDPNSGQPTTYMPVWYVMQMLKRAGVNSVWNGTSWALSTATQIPTTNRWNVAFTTNGTTSLSDVAAQRQNVNTLIPSAFDVTASGSLSADAGAATTAYAHAHGMRSIARAALSDPSQLSAILGNTSLSSQLVANLTNATVTDGYDGVNIDFEEIPATDRAEFVSFLQQLHQSLVAQGKLLTVDVPAVIDPVTEPWNQGYDFASIGQAVDKVIVMAYDYSYPTSKPGAIAPLWWVTEATEYAVTQMTPSKVLLGIDTYAYDWSTGPAKAYSLSTAAQIASSHGVTPTWDTFDEAPTFTYTLAGVTHTVYYESAQSLTPKIALVSQFNLGGMAVWRAGLEDADVTQVLNQFG